MKTWQKVIIAFFALSFLGSLVRDDETPTDNQNEPTVNENVNSDEEEQQETQEGQEVKEDEEDVVEIIDDRPNSIIVEINNEMHANERNANKVYGGKTYMITAVIDEIESTFWLGKPKMKMHQDNVYFGVSFDEDHDAIYNMRAGDTITIVATYDGFGIESEFTDAYLTQDTIDRFTE